MTNLLVVIGLNVAINFIPNTNISWQSHVGGFVMGVLLVFAMSRTRTLAPVWRTAADVAAVSAAVLAVTAAVMWGYRV